MIRLKSDISFKKPKLKQILIPLISIAIVALAAGGFFIYKNIKSKKQVAQAPKLTENKPTVKTEVKAAETTVPNSAALAPATNPQSPAPANTTAQTTQPKAITQTTVTPKPIAPAPVKTTVVTPTPAPAPVYNSNQIYSVTAAQAYVENQVFKLVNAERARVGVGVLAYNPALGQAAEIRVDEESNLSFAGEDHVRPNGTSFSTVFGQVGYVYHYCGENLLWGYQGIFNFTSSNLDNMANQMFTSWKNSPDHYTNMISRNYNETGLGVRLINANGHMYYFAIQEFGSR